MNIRNILMAKNTTEKDTAEAITRQVKGVKAVKNQIDVRP